MPCALGHNAAGTAASKNSGDTCAYTGSSTICGFGRDHYAIWIRFKFDAAEQLRLQNCNLILPTLVARNTINA